MLQEIYFDDDFDDLDDLEGDLEDDPDFPEIDGVTIQSAGKSSNISIINGDMSRTVVYKYLFNYIVSLVYFSNYNVAKMDTARFNKVFVIGLG